MDAGILNVKKALLIAGLAFSLNVLADAPPSLDVPDADSIVAKGILTLYRVQIKDLEFGKDQGKVNNELYITLDSTKDKVYTLELHDDSPKVNAVIANTLRDAYINKTPVTIYSAIYPANVSAAKIHLVQLDRRPPSDMKSEVEKAPLANVNN